MEIDTAGAIVDAEGDGVEAEVFAARGGGEQTGVGVEVDKSGAFVEQLAKLVAVAEG